VNDEIKVRFILSDRAFVNESSTIVKPSIVGFVVCQGLDYQDVEHPLFVHDHMIIDNLLKSLRFKRIDLLREMMYTIYIRCK
jgi:hypothetical protein